MEITRLKCISTTMSLKLQHVFLEEHVEMVKFVIRKSSNVV